MTRKETGQGPCRNPGRGSQYLAWAAALALGLMPGVALALPYYSYVDAGVQGIAEPYPGYIEREVMEGGGLSSASADTSAGIAFGSSRVLYDPANGLLKLEARGVYDFDNAGVPFSWEDCGEYGNCILQPDSFGVAGGQAYARSVWRVVSDELPAGTPVDLTLSLSLSGRIWGDTSEGTAEVQMRAWLNKREDLMALTGADPLDDDSYGTGIINWWPDVIGAPAPNLEILASSYGGGGDFSETLFSNACPPLIFCPPLPDVVVGDILVLETQLLGSVTMLNDGDRGVQPGQIYGDLLVADFYDTGHSGITVTTPGVQLVPVPEPQAVWMMLAGLGALILGRLTRRLRTAGG